jgi:hypothetical protein
MSDLLIVPPNFGNPAVSQQVSVSSDLASMSAVTRPDGGIQSGLMNGSNELRELKELNRSSQKVAIVDKSDMSPWNQV